MEIFSLIKLPEAIYCVSAMLCLLTSIACRHVYYVLLLQKWHTVVDLLKSV